MTHAEYLKADIETAEGQLDRAWDGLLTAQDPEEKDLYKYQRAYWTGYLAGATNALHAYNGMGE